MRKQHADRMAIRQRGWYGYLILIVGAFLVAWQTPLARILQDRGIPALGTVTMLFFVAAVLLNLIEIVSGKAGQVYGEARGHIGALLLMGGFAFFLALGLFFSVKTLDAGMAAVLLYLSPSFVCLFFLVTKIKPVAPVHLAAVAICLAGCALTLDVIHISLENLSVQGILFGVLAGACMAAYSLAGELLLPARVSRWTVTTIAVDVGAVLGAIVDPGMFVRFLHLGIAEVLVFLYLALVTKVIGLQVLSRGSQLIGPERATVVMSLEIPFTVVIAFFVLQQTMVPSQLVGIVLVVLSVILLRKGAAGSTQNNTGGRSA